MKDYAKSQDFYANKMGLHEAFKFGNQDNTRITTYYQLSRDTFLEMQQATADVPPGFTHVHLAVDDLNATTARLKQAGLPGSARGATTAGTVTEAGVAQPSNVKNANIIEPDGLRLELNELFRNLSQRKWRTPGSKKAPATGWRLSVSWRAVSMHPTISSRRARSQRGLHNQHNASIPIWS